MDYRPRCQHCQSKVGLFHAVTLFFDYAADRNLDPKSTSRMGFVCSSCGETFPAVAGGVVNVLDRHGAVWPAATTWFSMMERTMSS